MNFQNDHPNLEYLQRLNYSNLPNFTYNNKTFKSATHALDNYINEYYSTKSDTNHDIYENHINPCESQCDISHHQNHHFGKSGLRNTDYSRTFELNETDITEEDNESVTSSLINKYISQSLSKSKINQQNGCSTSVKSGASGKTVCFDTAPPSTSKLLGDDKTFDDRLSEIERYLDEDQVEPDHSALPPLYSTITSNTTANSEQDETLSEQEFTSTTLNQTDTAADTSNVDVHKEEIDMNIVMNEMDNILECFSNSLNEITPDSSGRPFDSSKLRGIISSVKGHIARMLSDQRPLSERCAPQQQDLETLREIFSTMQTAISMQSTTTPTTPPTTTAALRSESPAQAASTSPDLAQSSVSGITQLANAYDTVSDITSLSSVVSSDTESVSMNRALSHLMKLKQLVESTKLKMKLSTT